MTAWTWESLLKWGTDVLQEQEVMNASLDAWYLMEHVFGLGRVDFLLKREESLLQTTETQKLLECYQALIRRRSEGCPLQYLMGYTEFMGYRFAVDERVLIPRQDTEILVETALGFVKPSDRVLDMCTGSGCILLSLALCKKMASGTGVDISADALNVAKKNRERHGLRNVELIQSDLFEKIDGCYDMIVSNPPYIPTKDIDDLMREVRDFEPHLALDGSEDGLSFYRRLTKEAREHLVIGGMLLLEIGWNQAEDVKAMMETAGFGEIGVKIDLAGLDRVVYGRRVG